MLKDDDYGYASGSAVHLADIYLKKGNPGEAKRYIDLAADYYVKEPRENNLPLIYEALSKYYAATGDPDLTRDEMIKRLGTSKDLFIEAFQYGFQTSFTDCIDSLRMKDAVTLLAQSDLPIAAIADSTGFGTVRTFQRQFRIQYNMTPKNYRNSVKKDG